MTRRILLLLPFAACLHADTEKDLTDLIATAASGLSNAKPGQFLEAFDRSMPDYEKLRTQIVALNDQAELSCSIEIQRSEGTDTERVLTIDWILHLNPKGENPSTSLRQKTVTARVKKFGKKWRIVEFQPLDLFAPMGG